jgi:cation transport ATPase
MPLHWPGGCGRTRRAPPRRKPADIVLLGGEVEQVWQALDIARDTVRVATQGVLIGIGLSGLAMLAAAAGFLPPLLGAFLQEGIDVLVIANALRATTGNLGFLSPLWG